MEKEIIFVGLGLVIIFVFFLLLQVKNKIVYGTTDLNKIKGIVFEKKCIGELEKNGFEVFWRGKELGVKDGGIDIEAKKGNTLLLIQCKNYQKKAVIGGDLLRMFWGDVYTFLLRNDVKSFDVHYLFVSNFYQIDKSGKFWLEDNGFVKYFDFNGFKKAIK